jgi:hypothetical protein
MKKYIIGICCALLSTGVFAQTTISKLYPTQAGQQINLKFDYPVVRVSTWEKNEVSIIAHISINDGENDSAFVLEEHITNDALVISDHINDMDKLPRRYTIVRNGKKTIFKSQQEYREDTKRGGVEKSYEGLDIDIVLEIKVPEHSVTNIRAVYGIVELTGFNAPVTIDATYGGIDASITPERTGKLQVTTSYGEILTNLDLHLTDHTDRDFYHSISAEPGKGPAYSFTSDYGKIYLRKQ